MVGTACFMVMYVKWTSLGCTPAQCSVNSALVYQRAPSCCFVLSYVCLSVCSVCPSVLSSVCLSVRLSFIWLVLWQVKSKSLKFMVCVVKFCAMVLNKYRHKLEGSASETDRQTDSRHTDEAEGAVENVLNMI